MAFPVAAQTERHALIAVSADGDPAAGGSSRYPHFHPHGRNKLPICWLIYGIVPDMMNEDAKFALGF